MISPDFVSVFVLVLSFAALLLLGVPTAFSIGLCTPPVGSLLFVSCGIAKLQILEVIRPMPPLYAGMLLALFPVTYSEGLSLFMSLLLGC